MRVLITGGRSFGNRNLVYKTLDEFHLIHGITLLIHGDCHGADKLADGWARYRGVPVKACPADWAKHGKSAGPIRNSEMLILNPDFVIAFPGGRGTADMVKKALSKGLTVKQVQL